MFFPISVSPFNCASSHIKEAFFGDLGYAELCCMHVLYVHARNFFFDLLVILIRRNFRLKHMHSTSESTVSKSYYLNVIFLLHPDSVAIIIYMKMFASSVPTFSTTFTSLLSFFYNATIVILATLATT